MARGGAHLALTVLDGALPRHPKRGAAVVVYDAWTGRGVPGRSELPQALSECVPAAMETTRCRMTSVDLKLAAWRLFFGQVQFPPDTNKTTGTMLDIGSPVRVHLETVAAQ